MSYPFGPTVTVVKRVKSGTDSFGNDVWTTTQVPVKAQAFDPGTSTEIVQGQDVVTSQPTVYLPLDEDVAAIDAVIYQGVAYEVDGSPSYPQNPFTGRRPGIVVRLRLVTG